MLPCFPSLTLETLKTVLKINLMTLCTLTTFLCNPITNFYVFVIDGCMSDLEAYLKVSKVIFTVSIFIFPFGNSVINPPDPRIVGNYQPEWKMTLSIWPKRSNTRSQSSLPADHRQEGLLLGIKVQQTSYTEWHFFTECIKYWWIISNSSHTI